MTVTLLYHDVAAPAEADSVGFPGPRAARYKLSPEAFEAHLDAVAATGAAVGLPALDHAPPAVSISFDDGGASAPRAAEALERRGWRGHFFVTTERIGTDGFMTADQVRELAQRGHLVGSHSHTHPAYMGRLSRAELEREWRTSRDVLAELLGAPPWSASVPGGSLSSDLIEAAAQAGYGLLWTSEPTTRTRRVGPIVLAGRFALWATTPPATAAAYARGDRGVRARLALEYRLKHAAKRVSPRIYELARKVRAGG